MGDQEESFNEHEQREPLALLGWNTPDPVGEALMGGNVHGPVFHLQARGILAEEIVALPVPGRSNGPWNEPAAAIRAHIVQDVLDAGRAERAFVGANAGIPGVGGQCFVAVLARRTKLEHEQL